MTAPMKTMDLNFTRSITATPAEVYAAWLDPKTPVNPFHGARRLIFEPKVGSLYYIAAARGSVVYGRFDVLERDQRIEMTWMSNHTLGLESIVTVTFQATGEDTLLTLRHANLPDGESGQAYDEGWRHFLGLLEQRFATGGA